MLLPAACCCVQGANPKVALAAARVLPAESVLALVQLEEVPTKIRCRLLHAFARIYAPFYVDLEVVHDQVQALSQAARLVAEVRTPLPHMGAPALATHSCLSLCVWCVVCGVWCGVWCVVCGVCHLVLRGPP